MTEWYQKVKFPCGYEWEFCFNTWIAEPLSFPQIPTECPIHREKCKKEKELK
ncbi:MAG: hypothetical protein AABY22_09725 [Nanoarchaeota archaeon]